MPEQRSEDLTPYRFCVEFTAAARSEKDAEDIYDAMLAFADHACIYHELGSISEMDLEDVIPGSPLDAVISRRP